MAMGHSNGDFHMLEFAAHPPRHSVPRRAFSTERRRWGHWVIMRGFLVKADPKPAGERIKEHVRSYPLAQAAR